jgi:hypothetical protein
VAFVSFSLFISALPVSVATSDKTSLLQLIARPKRLTEGGKNYKEGEKNKNNNNNNNNSL